MQIVIKIPEEKYQWIREHSGRTDFQITEMLYKRVRNGTPLPKGHGRLLDEKEILASEEHDGCWYDLVDMPDYIAGVPAVIEADKAEIEGKQE